MAARRERRSGGSENRSREPAQADLPDRILSAVATWWRRYGEIPKRWLIFVAVIVLFAALDEWANDVVNRQFGTVTAHVPRPSRFERIRGPSKAEGSNGGRTPDVSASAIS